MTLIDTSAWIEFLRPGGDMAVKSRVKDHVLDGRAAFTCPVMFELVLGARPSEKKDLRMALDLAERIVVTAEHWDHAAGLASALRGKGLNFPALDLVIASVAFTESLELLTCDGHFERIRDEVLPGLRIVP